MEKKDGQFRPPKILPRKAGMFNNTLPPQPKLLGLLANPPYLTQVLFKAPIYSLGGSRLCLSSKKKKLEFECSIKEQNKT